MRTLVITKKDLDKNHKYIGKEELSDWRNPFDGHIEIDENLGYVQYENPPIKISRQKHWSTSGFARSV